MRTLLGLTLLVLLAVPAAAQEPPSPWELTRTEPGDYFLSTLPAVRAGEATYRETDWWSTYAQVRAQREAAAGNYAAALQWWDAVGGARSTAPEPLPAGVRAVDAVEFLAAVADTAQVVMVNEAHHVARHRVLTLRLLAPLYARGYRYLAAETFNAADTALAARGYPLLGTSGTYTDEVVFAAIVREALRLGYTLVPYEIEHDERDADDGLTAQQRRDRAQARHLQARIFAHDPAAKVLVHAGFAHIYEAADEDWYPMAVYFRELTGIDPVTVDQVMMTEASTPDDEVAVYRGFADTTTAGEPVILLQPDGTPLPPRDRAVDLQVFTPRTAYADARPTWMHLDGRRRPLHVRDLTCPDGCIVELTRAGEPADAVPLDRAEVADGGETRLFTPMEGGPFEIVVRGYDGAVLDVRRPE